MIQAVRTAPCLGSFIAASVGEVDNSIERLVKKLQENLGNVAVKINSNGQFAAVCVLSKWTSSCLL